MKLSLVDMIYYDVDLSNGFLQYVNNFICNKSFFCILQYASLTILHSFFRLKPIGVKNSYKYKKIVARILL